MAAIISRLFIAAILSTIARGNTPLDEYNAARAQIIESERCMGVGGKIVLNQKENTVNQFIMKEKRKTITESRINKTDYNPAVSFFLSKSWIESTPIFKIIQKMPKGAALHLHDVAVTSLDWVIRNLTYRDNVYMCVENGEIVQLSVFKTPPINEGCLWMSVKEERKESNDTEIFDLWIKKSLSMLDTDPLVSFPGVNNVWKRFEKYFSQTKGMLRYAPMRRDYFRRALVEFRSDNVQYVEMRGRLHGLYELNGTVYDAEHGLKMFMEVTDTFVKEFPDFSGAKFIMTNNRLQTKENVLQTVKSAMILYDKYPNFFLGFDLVAQEDPYNPLLYYIDELLYPSQQTPPTYLPYYFHAGETNWQGTDVDYNLVDALLLNTTRIGHGYALVKHPKLMEIVKKKGVAVEVNPLSNQILGLVNDLRNHAVTPLIAQDIPVVVSSDDPVIWEAAPMSHDLYLAFMDFTGEDADLSTLKHLILNSLQYSGMNITEKTEAFNLWQTKWDRFINDTIIMWKLKEDSSFGEKIRTTSCDEATYQTSSASSLNVLQIILVIPLYKML